MAGIIAAAAARPLLAAASAAAGLLAALGVGFGLGEAWEHRGPQGFPLNVAGASLALQRDQAREQLGGVRAQLRQAEADKLALRLAFTAAEGLRSIEHQVATSSAGEASRACEARIAEARRSAGAIARVVSRAPAL